MIVESVQSDHLEEWSDKKNWSNIGGIQKNGEVDEGRQVNELLDGLK